MKSINRLYRSEMTAVRINMISLRAPSLRRKENRVWSF
jgi:hypothetical protein